MPTFPNEIECHLVEINWIRCEFNADRWDPYIGYIDLIEFLREVKYPFASTNTHSFYFSNARDAMIFKLRFG